MKPTPVYLAAKHLQPRDATPLSLEVSFVVLAMKQLLALKPPQDAARQ